MDQNSQILQCCIYQNTPFRTGMCNFLLKWCALWYGTNAMLDLWIWFMPASPKWTQQLLTLYGHWYWNIKWLVLQHKHWWCEAWQIQMSTDLIHKSHNASVHIPQCTIQNRNVHISVLVDVLRVWDRCIVGFAKLVRYGCQHGATACMPVY